MTWCSFQARDETRLAVACALDEKVVHHFGRPLATSTVRVSAAVGGKATTRSTGPYSTPMARARHSAGKSRACANAPVGARVGQLHVPAVLRRRRARRRRRSRAPPEPRSSEPGGRAGRLPQIQRLTRGRRRSRVSNPRGARPCSARAGASKREEEEGRQRRGNGRCGQPRRRAAAFGKDPIDYARPRRTRRIPPAGPAICRRIRKCPLSLWACWRGATSVAAGCTKGPPRAPCGDDRQQNHAPNGAPRWAEMDDLALIGAPGAGSAARSPASRRNGRVAVGEEAEALATATRTVRRAVRRIPLARPATWATGTK